MPPTRSRSLVAVLGGLVALAVSTALSVAADEPPAGAVVPSDPVFQALQIDGTTFNGRIQQIGPDGKVVLEGDAETKEIPFDRLVKLTRQGDPPPYPPEGSLIVLPEGDRLRAIINATKDESLEVLPNALGDVATTIRLDRMLGLVLAPPSEPSAQEALIQKIRDDQRNSEVLWLANGDRMTGSFLGLDLQKVAFQPDAGRADLDRSGVVALGFNPALVSYRRPDGIFLELTFVDGSRLGVTECRKEHGQIVATTRFGATIRPALKELSRVHVRGGPVVYLSEREASAAQYVPYLSSHPESFGRDATWDGHHLQLHGEPFDRGLGMLPRTLVAYKLEPGDRRFQALVGLDDRAGEKGSVVFRVLADKKELFASPILTRHDAPQLVDVDVQGARFLILVVEFGDRGDIQDSADWIEARLIR